MRSVRPFGLLSSLVLLLLACGSDEMTEPEDAFVESPDEGLPMDLGVDAFTEPDAGLDCGPNGEAHGDHCDCHRGYIEQDGRCEPLPECVGDDPLEPDDIARDASTCDVPCERALCAADRDHLLIERVAGDELRVRAIFDAHEQILLTLYEPDRDPRFDEPVARAELSSGESFEFTVRQDGEHLLRIQGDPFDATGVYLLELM